MFDSSNLVYFEKWWRVILLSYRQNISSIHNYLPAIMAAHVQMIRSGSVVDPLAVPVRVKRTKDEIQNKLPLTDNFIIHVEEPLTTSSGTKSSKQ